MTKITNILLKKLLTYLTTFAITFLPLLSTAFSPNFARATDQTTPPSLTLMSISQNGTELSVNEESIHHDDQDQIYYTGYLAPSYDSPISVTYRLNDLEIGKNYQIKANISSSNGSAPNTFTANSTAQEFTEVLSLDYTTKNQYLYFNFTSPGQNSYPYNYYSTPSYQITISDPSFSEIGSIILDSVVQNGDEVSPVYSENSNTYTYTLNDVQPYSILLHTENAMDDYMYSVRANWNSPYLTFSGAELKNGITLDNTTVSISNHSSISSLYFKDSTSHSLRNPESAYSNCSINVVADESLPRIEGVNLKYANYPEIDINYSVDMRYHNSENPLALYIKGKNLNDDENYSLDLKINTPSRNSAQNSIQNILTRTITKTGSELNQGTLVTIDDFTMSLMAKDSLIVDAFMYNFTVSYYGQTFNFSYDYGYEDNSHLMNMWPIITETESLNSPVIISSSASPISYTTVATTPVYAHVSTQNLPVAESFDYEIYATDGRPESESLYDLSNKQPTITGRASGADLNSGKITLLASSGSGYFVLVEKDGLVVSWEMYYFEQSNDHVGISKIATKSANQYPPITPNIVSPYYNVKKGEPIEFTIQTQNLDDSTTYHVTSNLAKCMGDSFGGACVAGTVFSATTNDFTGEELNNGTATISLPYSEDFYAFISDSSTNLGGLTSTVGSINFEIQDLPSMTPSATRINFNYVDPSFSTTLIGDDEFTNEITLELAVNDYRYLSEDCNGIAGIIGDLEYDHDKIELLSATGINGFELEQGDHYVLHNTSGEGIPSGTSILELKFKNKTLARGESTDVAFTNIIGSDSNNDISSPNVTKTITLQNQIPSITSEIYNISEDIITRVPTSMTASSFLDSLVLGGGASLVVTSVDGDELQPSDRIGTGSKVQLFNAYSELFHNYTIVIKGDISGDGDITITDLVKAKRQLAGLENLSSFQITAGDITNTGSISITDVVRICRHIAHLGVITQ